MQNRLRKIDCQQTKTMRRHTRKQDSVFCFSLFASVLLLQFFCFSSFASVFLIVQTSWTTKTCSNQSKLFIVLVHSNRVSDCFLLDFHHFCFHLNHHLNHHGCFHSSLDYYLSAFPSSAAAANSSCYSLSA